MNDLTFPINLPEILDIPKKMMPMIFDLNKYRYVLAEGGRGGGKSQSIGRFILYLAEKYNVRVVCGRETQNSIAESVYSLMVDLIRLHNLANYKVYSTKIEHLKSGATINFRGFREQGAFNIQGMEGVDIIWIDEAQAITKQTLDVLIPTIRKDNARIFFSMNRHVEDDPVYITFWNRADCLHININFDDNPFCTDALKREAEECKNKSMDDYRHIWLGMPLAKGDDAVFSRTELLESSRNPYGLREGYGRRLAGFDIARYGDDKCACVIIQQQGALNWEVIFVDQWGKSDLNYSTGRILTTTNEMHVEKAAIDEDGIGSGPLDTLQKGRELEYFIGFRNTKYNYADEKDYANPRTKAAYRLKQLVSNGHIVISDKELIDELCTIRYTYDHQQRKILISKEKMKQEGVKSPNLADALFYAVSLIDDVRARDERKYFAHPQYCKDDNLYELAGVR